MASYNKVIICGNLGRDPELRATQTGKQVANFSIATSFMDKTEWHNIVAWDKQAESCSKYLTKGSSALVEGRLQTRSWDDKDGNKRYTTEIVATNVQFMGGKKDQLDADFQTEVAESDPVNVPF